MTQFRLNTTNVMPPGGFRYFVGDTGTWIPPHGRDPYIAFGDLESAVTAHLKANNASIPPNLSALIEEQICVRLNDFNWCNRGSPATTDQIAAQRAGWKFTFGQVVSFTSMMADWFAHGKHRVSDETVKARSEVCIGCPNNMDPPGCGACNMKLLLSVASRIVGGQISNLDGKLRSCAICGCSLRGKVRVPSDVLLRHIEEDKLDRLPEHCWLAKDRKLELV